MGKSVASFERDHSESQRMDETTNGNDDDHCRERQHASSTSLFSLSKYSRTLSNAVSNSQRSNVAKKESRNKRTTTYSIQNKQRAIPIPSFVGVNDALERCDNDGVDVLAKVERALMMVNSYHDDDDRTRKRSKDKPSNDSKVAASKSGPVASIPIPTFYCLDVDDNDDDDKEDDGLLTMQPIFRKPQQSSVVAKEIVVATPAATTNITFPNGADAKVQRAECNQGCDECSNDDDDDDAKKPQSIAKNADVDNATSTISLQDLLVAADSIYSRSDPETTTLKSILSSIESTVGVTLTRDQRKQVKQHVRNQHFCDVNNSYSNKQCNEKSDSKPTTNNKGEPQESSVLDELSCAMPTDDDLVVESNGNPVEFNDDPVIESEKADGGLQEQLTTESSPNAAKPQTTTTSTKEQVATIDQGSDSQAKTPQQPTADTLQSATERLYSFSDPNTTMQEVWEAMESYLGVTLSKRSQALVEQQWNTLKDRTLASNAATPIVTTPMIQNPAEAQTLLPLNSANRDSIRIQDMRTTPAKIETCQDSSNSAIALGQRCRLGTSFGTSRDEINRGCRVLPTILEETLVDSATEEYATCKMAEQPSWLGGLSARPERQDAPSKTLNATIQQISAPLPSSNLVDVTNQHARSNTNHQDSEAMKHGNPTKELHSKNTSVTDSTTTNQGRKRRFRKAATIVTNTNQSISLPSASLTSAPATKNNRKRPRKDSCSLCATCPCSNNESNEATSILELSRSEAEIERALLRRLAKLDRTTESYEQQKEAVKKELKKLRRKFLKRQFEKLGLEKVKPFGDSYFLPDADAWDETFQDVSTASLPQATVAKAKVKIFPPGGQPTLTQMLGRQEGPKEMQEVAADVHELVGEAENETADGECNLENNVEVKEGSDCDDTSFIACEAAEEETGYQAEEHVHRITWNPRSKSPVASPSMMRTTGVWHAATFGGCQPNPCHPDRYATSWDGLFAQLDADDGIEDLVEMFDDSSTTTPEKPIPPAVDKSLLSQPSRKIVEAVEGTVLGHAEKQSAVESVCDNWQENIAFAFTRDESEVRDALDNVRQSKEKLMMNMAKIREAYQRREALLELYKQALEKARDRLQTKSKGADWTERGEDTTSVKVIEAVEPLT